METKTHKEQHALWIADQGEKKRTDYPLDHNSIVIDVGGYKGDWAHLINDKYASHILIYEPVESYYNSIRDRFAGNPNIVVNKFGLGGSTRKEMISLNADAASIYTGDGTEEIDIVDISKVLIEDVDLMKINIEGAEYELLDRLIETGLISKIRNIQVQFHTFVPDAGYRREMIIDALKKTHKPTYSYPFVWENFVLNDAYQKAVDDHKRNM